MIAMENEFKLEIGEKQILRSNFKHVQILQEQIQVAETLFSLDLTKAAAFVKELELHAKERLMP